MVDFITNEDIEVQPPLPQSETPLVGNPVLMRGTNAGRRSPRGKAGAGGSRMAWYVGVPVAVVLLGGAALFVTSQNSRNSGLMTNAATTNPPAEQASTAAPTAAPMAPTAVPTPAPPVAAAPAAIEPAMKPVQPTHAPRFASAEPRATRHLARAARSADDSTADTSAVAPSAPAVAAPVTAAPTPAPVAPVAPPVITPPPSSQ